MDERTAVFILLWTAGLVAGFWMARRGHDPRWIVLGAILGPIFVPVAIERVRNHPVVVSDRPVPRDDDGLRVLVAYDGSPESREAVAAAGRLFARRATTIVLAQVVPYDASDDAGQTDIRDARDRLAEVAAELGAPGVSWEVLAGPPAETLCTWAWEQEMDLLVVGRRGRGLSQRLLGSVADRVVKTARLPVLVAQAPVAGPVQPRSSRLDQAR